MQYTITPLQMKQLETTIISRGTVNGKELMHRASSALCTVVDRNTKRGGHVLFVCGRGNNGGDGLCAARMLLEAREDISVDCLQSEGTLSEDCEREKQSLLAEFEKDARFRLYEQISCLQQPDTIVDAMFGTGFNCSLKGEALEFCRWTNRMHEGGSLVIACDIPSGLNGTNGEINGECVECDYTVTFHRAKQGLFLKEGPNVCGKIIVADIGLSEYAEDRLVSGMAMLDRIMLPKRKKVSNKGDYGRVLLFCGSFGMAGAAALCANAAMRTGAGLCSIAAKRELIPILQHLAPCATCIELSDNATAAWETLHQKTLNSNAVAVGCGLGQSGWAGQLVLPLLEACGQHHIPCVADADALNLLSTMPNDKIDLGSDLYITPHPGEAARLLRCSVSDILSNSEKSLVLLQQQYECNVLLKGARTLMMDCENRTAVNPCGTPALAKGGSGDVLCGILTALLAAIHTGTYSMHSLLCMQTACALHVLAAENAEKQYGERGVLAADLLNYLGLFCNDRKLLEAIEFS